MTCNCLWLTNYTPSSLSDGRTGQCFSSFPTTFVFLATLFLVIHVPSIAAAQSTPPIRLSTPPAEDGIHLADESWDQPVFAMPATICSGKYVCGDPYRYWKDFSVDQHHASLTRNSLFWNHRHQNLGLSTEIWSGLISQTGARVSLNASLTNSFQTRSEDEANEDETSPDAPVSEGPESMANLLSSSGEVGINFSLPLLLAHSVHDDSIFSGSRIMLMGNIDGTGFTAEQDVEVQLIQTGLLHPSADLVAVLPILSKEREKPVASLILQTKYGYPIGFHHNTSDGARTRFGFHHTESSLAIDIAEIVRISGVVLWTPGHQEEYFLLFSVL